MMDFLIIIILTEHMIVVVKVIMMDYIGDVPIWVQKKLITVNNKQEELNIEFKKIEMNKKSTDLEKKVKEMLGKS